MDFVKIDMEIVHDIDGERPSRHRPQPDRHAHDRGIRVIAEGVETEAELRALRELALITCRATSPGGLLLSRAMSTTRSSASSAA
ncbi:MAG: hypothetical protein ACLTMP_13535 [Eggerthella lenta]